MSSTLDALTQRAKALSGLTLYDVASAFNIEIKQEKGWIGLLIETALMAEAGSKPLPDFPDLGVELKTIPIDTEGRVKESTFVSTVNLKTLTHQTWEHSLVRQKLSHVLWVPIESTVSVHFSKRRIGLPFFWKLSGLQEEWIKADWVELTDKLQLGEMQGLTSYSGEVLQIRPKGADSHALTKGFDELGQPCLTLPRGFYLRASFTESLLAEALMA